MKYRLFLDLDGVLVDFERGVLEATGKPVDEQTPRQMWSALARTPGFYANLHWMPDGRRLWDYAASKEPVVLTGLPFGRWARPQKLEWCARELGPEVPVITCFTREKTSRALEHVDDGETPVIVDDRDRIREGWEAAGGIFIHHSDAESSIEALKALGI